MAKVKVTAQQKITGRHVGVVFVDGVATVDSVEDRQALAYFGRHAGYKVEELAEESPVEEQAKTPARSGSKAEWVGYAIGAGMTEAEAEGMTRDQLAEKFLGPKGSE